MLASRTAVPGAAAIFGSGRRIGGDAYHLARLDHGRIGVFQAAVEEKGIAAALIAAVLLAFVKQQPAEAYAEPRDFLERLGGLLREHVRQGTVTALCGWYAPSSRTLLCAGAGHSGPLVLERGAARWLGRLGDPLSCRPTEPSGIIAPCRIVLKPGERILLGNGQLLMTPKGVASADCAQSPLLAPVLSGDRLPEPERLLERLRRGVSNTADEMASQRDVCLICLGTDGLDGL
jgi:serine phosphatase RsbU (regulator of sigma subunit)